MDSKFGWVVLWGPTNAGKSTLLNRILGQKVAIVSPRPQTTRNRISAILTRPDGQAVLLDTPGSHGHRGTMNKFLMDSASRAAEQADAVLLVLDAQLYSRKPDLLEKDLAWLGKAGFGRGRPLLVALNKLDTLDDRARVLPLIDNLSRFVPGAEFFPVSALRGEGVDELVNEVFKRLPDGEPQYPEDEISTLPMRFLAQEIVREKLFLALRQELPYQTAVEVENWVEDEAKGLTSIDATIYVARSSHKGMVIGKGGELLKDIGAKARVEIEELIQGKVFLRLWVKVKPDWFDDPAFLRRLGVGD